MTRSLIALACAALLFAGAVRAQEPQGAAPTLRVVSNVDNKGQTVSFRVFEMVPVTEQRKVIETVMKDGQVVQVERAVPVTVYKTVVKESAVSVKGVSATDGTGKKLTTEEALGRLKAGQAVVICHGGTGLAAAYRGLFSKDAVILHLPQPAPPTAPVPVPVPVPPGGDPTKPMP
jgi:hypothetical protein